MLTLSSAPPAACTASGPNGDQMSSQIDTPTLTPAISYSSSGSLSVPGVNVRASSNTA